MAIKILKPEDLTPDTKLRFEPELTPEELRKVYEAVDAVNPVEELARWCVDFREEDYPVSMREMIEKMEAVQL